MKRVLYVFLLIAFTAAITTLAVYDDLTGHFPWSNKPTDGSVTLQLSSRVLDEVRDVIVWVPAGYDSTKTYPVIYALDGQSLGAEIAQTTDVLAAAGFAPPSIVIGIPNVNEDSRKRDLTPPYLKQDNDQRDSPVGHGDRFLEFLETELIPFVESRFPASGERLICGHSRAGLLVLYSLLLKPHLFDARFCFSTPLWREDGRMIAAFREFLSSHDSLKTLLYVTAGDRETERIKSGLRDMHILCEETKPIGLVYHLELTARADHGNNSRLSMPGAIGFWARNTERPIQPPAKPERTDTD